jgi:hypothetical protein
MSKSFYMGGAWARNERMIRQRENRYSEYNESDQVEQKVGSKSRMRARQSVLGLDSKDFHYKGDPVVILKEEPIEGGEGVRLYFERISSSQDSSAGTYAIEARKSSDGRHVFGGGARRIKSF